MENANRRKFETTFGICDTVNNYCTYLLENISSLIVVHNCEEELVGECR